MTSAARSETPTHSHDAADSSVSSRAATGTPGRSAARERLQVQLKQLDFAAGAAALSPIQRAGQAPPDATTVAEAGFGSPGRDVPHRSAMERSFGADFGQVQAYTGPAATAACDALGAEAYAVGDQVAFRRADPSPATVAHELTHVVQATDRPAAKGAGSGRGVDTSGEAEAEAVERTVAAGGEAREALNPAGSGRDGDAPALAGRNLSAANFPAAFLLPTDGGYAVGRSYQLFALPDLRIPLGTPFTYARLELSSALDVVASWGDAQGESGIEGNVNATGTFLLGAGWGEKAEAYGRASLTAAMSVGLQITPELMTTGGNDLVVTGDGGIGFHLFSTELELALGETEMLRFVNFRIDTSGVHYDEVVLGEEVADFLRMVYDVVFFDESMQRNRLVDDSDYIATEAALAGDLNGCIIHAQAGNDPRGRGPEWVEPARAIHLHLWEGHLAEAIEALKDDDQVGELLDDEGVDLDAITNSSISTLQTLLDSRTCAMTTEQTVAARQRLDAFCEARRGRGVSSTTATHARNVLRALAQGRTQAAATDLRFQSRPR